MLAFATNAHQINHGEAASIAADFFKKTAFELSVSPHTIRSRSDVSSPTYGAPYYIFNAENNNGFVIISGDDRLPEILAYSHTGHFDYSANPEELNAFFSDIEKSIANLNQKPYTRPRTVNKSVEPLLKTTWGQDHPYNKLTPVSEGIQTPTGCTNTALAQIMKYWRYPERGNGIVSYEWMDQTLSADLSKSLYQWNMMLDNYDPSINATEEQENAVALLVRDCGYANHTEYSPFGSGTGVLYGSLVEKFGYDRAIKDISRKFCTLDEYEDILRTELNASRPILMSGIWGRPHAFVCDGYDQNGYFHFNFGWGGSSDGYYLVDDSERFSGITVGIQPDCGGKPIITFASNQDFQYVEGNIEYFIPIYSFPLKDLYDDYNALLYNPDSDEYCQFASICENIETGSVYVFANTQINYYPLPNNLPDGKYIIYPAFKWKDQDWKKFMFAENLQKYIDLTVKDQEYSYSNNNIVNTIDDDKIELDGIYYFFRDNEAIVTFKNDRYKSYSGDIVIPSVITYNGLNYNVTEIGENAFCASKINSLFISENIKKINKGAFGSNTGEICQINDLRFETPSQLEEIGDWGFSCCDIDSVFLPLGVKVIGECAFQLSAIKYIDLPISIQYIDCNTFSDCYKLEEVHVHWTSVNDLPSLLSSESQYTHIFSGCNLENINLYVPKGTMDIYKSAPQWSDLNIVEHDDHSGVNIFPVDENDVHSIYNLQGICIKQNAKQETIYHIIPGLYIIDGKKVYIR